MLYIPSGITPRKEGEQCCIFLLGILLARKVSSVVYSVLSVFQCGYVIECGHVRVFVYFPCL